MGLEVDYVNHYTFYKYFFRVVLGPVFTIIEISDIQTQEVK
jgi:hypothetical protein